jgi:BON domain
LCGVRFRSDIERELEAADNNHDKEDTMIRNLSCALLLLGATMAFGQQQPSGDQGQKPPSGAPPQTQQPPSQTQQPAAPAPQERAMSNSDIQSQVESTLGNDPSLSGAQVQASVDDTSITLTGTVQSQAQKDRVLALVSPYQAQRKIVNKVTVK